MTEPPSTLLYLCSGTTASLETLERLATSDEYGDSDILVHHIRVIEKDSDLESGNEKRRAAQLSIQNLNRRLGDRMKYTENLIDHRHYIRRRPDLFHEASFIAAHICMAARKMSHVVFGDPEARRGSGDRRIAGRRVFETVYSLDTHPAGIPEFVLLPVDRARVR